MHSTPSGAAAAAITRRREFFNFWMEGFYGYVSFSTFEQGFFLWLHACACLLLTIRMLAIPVAETEYRSAIQNPPASIPNTRIFTSPNNGQHDSSMRRRSALRMRQQPSNRRMTVSHFDEMSSPHKSNGIRERRGISGVPFIVTCSLSLLAVLIFGRGMPCCFSMRSVNHPINDGESIWNFLCLQKMNTQIRNCTCAVAVKAHRNWRFMRRIRWVIFVDRERDKIRTCQWLHRIFFEVLD